jgi:hypothetical protein
VLVLTTRNGIFEKFEQPVRRVNHTSVSRARSVQNTCWEIYVTASKFALGLFVLKWCGGVHPAILPHHLQSHSVMSRILGYHAHRSQCPHPRQEVAPYRSRLANIALLSRTLSGEIVQMMKWAQLRAMPVPPGVWSIKQPMSSNHFPQPSASSFRVPLAGERHPRIRAIQQVSRVARALTPLGEPLA